MEKKFAVGIIGGAGYTGGEAIRILLNHPGVEISFVHSRSNAGNYLFDVHSDLLGESELKFSEKWHFDVDVMFLCLGHGESRKFMEELKDVPTHVKIIDLSQDFRLFSNKIFDDRDFVYGLPELNRSNIIEANNIANPGCFATCIQLGILPLANAGLLGSEVHIQATTGSTGAGQSLSPTSHFSWRHSNLSVYKTFTHQHLNEIKQSVKQLQSSFEGAFNFIPQRGAFARGILATLYTKVDNSIGEINDLYQNYYEGSPFVHVSDKQVHLKQVVNTNKCLLAIEKHGDNVLITSIVDNLLKGASGQAVQNMNLMLGLDETTGLKLKPLAY